MYDGNRTNESVINKIKNQIITKRNCFFYGKSDFQTHKFKVKWVVFVEIE